jgi:hypothetical protein
LDGVVHRVGRKDQDDRFLSFPSGTSRFEFMDPLTQSERISTQLCPSDDPPRDPIDERRRVRVERGLFGEDVVVDDPSRGRQGGRDGVWGFKYHC